MIQIIILKNAIGKRGGETMIRVSDAALKQIKTELENILKENEDVTDPYIRLYMASG